MTPALAHAVPTTARPTRPAVHPAVRAAAGERLVVVPPTEVPRGAKVLGIVVALPDLRQHTASPAPLRAVPDPRPTAGRRPAPTRELRPGLVLQRTDRVLIRDGARIELTRREYDLLDHLTARPRRILTRAALLATVWGSSVSDDTRTVDVHVLRLRRKLGADHAASLDTVRGSGYRWIP